jgi:glucosyl-dolichyl phosphate glucuronosyltransferase
LSSRSGPGKSSALNTGIEESQGDILAFVDDDVEVDCNWLSNLTRNLIHGEWSGVGGRILPEAGFVPPAWMETKGLYALAPLAVFDRGSEGAELTESPFGTNMAFRRSMFSKHGGFRTDLGPQPGRGIRHNEDSEFGSRLLAAGERFWYEPSAVVYHSVSRERLRKEHFLSWWFDKSRADIRQDGVPNDTKIYIAGVPAYVLRRLIIWSIRWLSSFDPARRFTCKLNVWKLAGIIQECRLHSKSRSSFLQRARVTTHADIDRL